MQMTSAMCTHQPVAVGGIEIVACCSCASVEWHGPDRVLDPAEGMAAVFGEYRLIGSLPAIRAPEREVLMYAAPNRRARSHLAAFPANTWMQADDHLWMSHDGFHLLLAPTSPILLDNLTRQY
jgi:hypothetical protein